MMTEESVEWKGETARDNNDKNKRRIFNMYLNNKSKIMASVYNIYRRHPSNPAPFSLAPVVLLGRCYLCDNSIASFHYINDNAAPTNNPPKLNNKNTNNSSPHIARFIKDFESLVWFTYRKDFPPIGPADITSDIGWGCMLRTGQMMLAEALIIHFLGRDWHFSGPDLQPYSIYRQLLRLFADSPAITCPFSLHNIVHKNKAMTPTLETNYKGEVWFAPSVIAKVLRSLVHQHGPDSFAMYVSSDGVICKDKVELACTQPRDNNNARVNVNDNVDHGGWRSVFILVPVRLGIEKLNPVYFRAICECLKMPQTVGIIGGKPKQSFYFVGFQEDYLIYLDPHIVHETVRPDRDFSNETYHCRAPQKIHLSEVDPSLAVGFYCRDREDFEQFCVVVKQLEQETDFLFSVVDEQPVYGSDEEDDVVIV
jgi:cysteine protease ATG4